MIRPTVVGSHRRFSSACHAAASTGYYPASVAVHLLIVAAGIRTVFWQFGSGGQHQEPIQVVRSRRGRVQERHQATGRGRCRARGRQMSPVHVAVPLSFASESGCLPEEGIQVPRLFGATPVNRRATCRGLHLSNVPFRKGRIQSCGRLVEGVSWLASSLIPRRGSMVPTPRHHNREGTVIAAGQQQKQAWKSEAAKFVHRRWRVSSRSAGYCRCAAPRRVVHGRSSPRSSEMARYDVGGKRTAIFAESA